MLAQVTETMRARTAISVKPPPAPSMKLDAQKHAQEVIRRRKLKKKEVQQRKRDNQKQRKRAKAARTKARTEARTARLVGSRCVPGMGSVPGLLKNAKGTLGINLVTEEIPLARYGTATARNPTGHDGGGGGGVDSSRPSAPIIRCVGVSQRHGDDSSNVTHPGAGGNTVRNRAKLNNQAQSSKHNEIIVTGDSREPSFDGINTFEEEMKVPVCGMSTVQESIRVPTSAIERTQSATTTILSGTFLAAGTVKDNSRVLTSCDRTTLLSGTNLAAGTVEAKTRVPTPTLIGQREGERGNYLDARGSNLKEDSGMDGGRGAMAMAPPTPGPPPQPATARSLGTASTFGGGTLKGLATGELELSTAPSSADGEIHGGSNHVGPCNVKTDEQRSLD